MISPTTQEKQYRFELTEFILKNPSADEKYFINHRIEILEDVLKEWKHTADFYEGEELEGKEFINGVWTVTKTGTASDCLYFSKELDFLKAKFKEITEPKQDTTPPTPPSIFVNNFDNVQESKVIEYFTKTLVDKKYLTAESLSLYLKQAFDAKTPPSKRFSFENLPTQDRIRKIFYEYYKITAGKPNGKKRAYVELLGEYFNGFDTAKIDTNFSK